MNAIRKILIFFVFLTPFLAQAQDDKSERQKAFEKELEQDSYLEHRRYFEEQLGKEGEYGNDRFLQEFFHMLLILAFLVGGLFLVAWLFRKFMGGRVEQLNVTSAIKILEQRSVSQRTSIYLVELHGRRILFTESTNGVTLLSTVSESENLGQ